MDQPGGEDRSRARPAADRYSRQIRVAGVGSDGQERLKKATVLVVGVGALGTHSAEALARAGVGNLWLVDRDIVELSNLQRQVLFSEADAAAGTPKAIAAAHALAQCNRECAVSAHVADCSAEFLRGLPHRPDLVLDGTDNFPTRYLINDWCAEQRIPWIYAGAVGSEGAAMVLPRGGPCLRCLWPEPPAGADVGNCETAGILAPAIAAVTAFQVAEALRLLCQPEAVPTRGVFTCDVWRGSYGVLPVGVASSPDCPVCRGEQFPALHNPPTSAVTLCGRDAVQIDPPRGAAIDLEALQARLAGVVTELVRTPHLLRFAADGCRFSVFPGGRTLLFGVADPLRARALYDRWVGCTHDAMIYLDHAATSYPKPAAVLAAIRHWYEDLGVSAERGDSARCAEVKAAVDETRARLGALVSVPGRRVAFTSGATEALNLALRAVLREGDAVLTTAFEHSSVVRPLLALQRQRHLRVEYVTPSPAGGLPTDEVAAMLAALRPRLFVFTHASNVTGALFDAGAFCELAARNGALSLLDTSQTAGLFDLRVGQDLTAGSCHKALHGPPGLGFLAAREGLELPSQKQGGTGSSIALAEHPTTWPQAFEAGTPNTPAILGQLAALRWIEAEQPKRLLGNALQLTEQLLELLARKPAVRLLHPPPGPRTPVLSFVHRQLDPAEVGSMLDAAGIAVRTGFHCAPWLHGHLGTAAAGTVRMSTGPGLSAADIRTAAAAVAD